MSDRDGSIANRARHLFECVRSYAEKRVDGFDAKFETDTAKPLIDNYVATSTWLLYEVLSSIPLRSNEFVFVDVGSGKGRALLVASEFPFRKIIGIELSQKLNGIARENIKKYRSSSQQCTEIEIRDMNAVDYAFGQEPLVVFLYNPFGRESFKKILRNLEATLSVSPREVFVVYVYPEFDELFEGSGFLRKFKKGGCWWQPWNSYFIYAAANAEGS